MSTRFHVNPDTGDVRVCSATKKCRFGENAPHYSNHDDARSAYEKSQGTQVETLTKTSRTVKNLFASVFTRRSKHESKPELSKVEETVEPVEPVEPQVLDTVLESKDGGFEVAVNDRQLGPLTHKFGDLITDQETAERLHKADPKKDYQLGECGVIAAELWNRNENVKDYYILKTDADPDFGIHHFVQLKDGTIVDSQGLWTEQDFLKVWKEVDSTSFISTFDLEPEPEKRNPKMKLSRPELFNILNDLIDKHVTVTESSRI